MSQSALDIALALHRAGRLAEAEAAYRNAHAAGDADAGAALAVLLLQAGRYGEAADVLCPLSQAAPENAELAANLSLALRREGRIDEAHAAALRATQLAPQRASGWNALGLAALEAGRPDEALAAFEAGLKVAPTLRALQLHRAQTLRRLQRMREAMQAFAALAQAAPELVDAWRGLGDTQSALGHSADALRSRARAAQLASHDAEVAFEHGIALMQAGEAAAAARIFRSLLDHDASKAVRWFWLGRAQLKLDDLDGARTSFGEATTRDPAHPTFAHFHAAASGALPAAVEDDFIRDLFNDFADRFEHTLIGQLAYATPARLGQLLRDHGGDRGDTVLDLGCGTGLMAPELARDGRSIDGVDLSPRMLEHARAKGLYRALHAAEIIGFLREHAGPWDVAVAADVFVYIAELQPVFAALRPRLPIDGLFAFSVERSGGDATELLPATGRYRHAEQRTREDLAAHGFEVVAHEAVVLRMESGTPVQGDLFLARRNS